MPTLLDQIDDLKSKMAPAAQEPGSEIHGMPVSANAVGAILYAKHVLGDNCEFKVCNLMAGEQMKPEFLSMNPFHTVPTFKDSNGFSLGESNAILRYIANKYSPKDYGGDDVEKKAMVDWALDLRSQKIYSDHKKCDFANVVYPVMGFAEPPKDQAATNTGLVESLTTYASLFLKDSKFLGGDEPNIADFSLAPIIFSLGHSTIKAKTGFELPARWATYSTDFVGAVPAAAMLSNAGGYSISEFLDSKAGDAAPPAAPTGEDEGSARTKEVPAEKKTYADHPGMNKLLPDLSGLEFIQGEPLEAGKACVVFIWGKYAKGDYRTIVDFSDLANKYPEVQILGISCDPGKDAAEALLGKANKAMPEQNIPEFKISGLKMAWDNGKKVTAEFKKICGKTMCGPGDCFIFNPAGKCLWLENFSGSWAMAQGQFVEQVTCLKRGVNFVTNGPRPVLPGDENIEEECDMGDGATDYVDAFNDEGNGDY